MKTRYLYPFLCVAFLCISQTAWAQFTVTGTVTNAQNNKPLIGANVYDKSSGNGASTDQNGKFSIDLPGQSATLRVSYIGFLTKNVSVSASNNKINVALKPDVSNLEQTVVTGLATSTKRENVANSVTRISADELQGSSPNQTLSSDLYGKIPGALVSENSGAPGGGISVRLRGVSTINGSSQPLYIVDGVYYNNSANLNGSNAVTAAAQGGSASNQDNPTSRIADINPDDIASIQVLKGASAAAIYGQRASNGVVIIKTKRGTAGQAQFSASQSVGFTEIQRKLGTRQFTAQTAEDAFGDRGLNAFQEAQQNNQFFDYEDLLYGQKGFLRRTDVSASFGTDKTSFYISGLLQNDDGIVKTTGYEKQSIRANLDHNFTKRFNVSISSNYVHSSANRGLTGNDNTGTTFGVSLTATPNFADLLPDKNGIYPDNLFGPSNVLQTRDLFSNNEDVNRITTSFNANYDLQRSATNVLSLKFIGGVDFYNQENKLIFPSRLQFEKVAGSPGTLVETPTRNLNTNTRTLLIDEFTPGNNLTITSQAGYTTFNQDQNGILNVGHGILGDQTNLDQVVNNNIDQTKIFERNRGIFLQEKLNVSDTYIITGGFRADKSDRNGDVNKFYLFPKASVAWNITSEPFWKSDFLNNLKLRAAFGQTGNLSQFGAKFTTLGVSNIGGLGGILINNTRGRSDLKPERQTEIEAGVDASLSSGFASLQFTVYQKDVKDLLLQRQLPPSTGFQFESFNAGELRNRGIETSLTLRPYQSKNFNWNATFNFSLNRSKVTDLPVPSFDVQGFGLSLGLFRIQQGRSATQIVGIDPKTDENGNLVTDDNGNPVIVTKKLGDHEPDFNLSLSNTMHILKNLDFSFLLQWKKGGDNINLTTLLYDLNGTSAGYNTHDLHFADFRAKAAGIKPGDSDATKQNKLLGVSTVPFIEDASYLRLRSVGLYYTIPVSVVSHISPQLRRIRIGVSGNDLFTVTPYSGYDPEVSNFGNQPIGRGVDVLPYPSTKAYYFHFKIDF